MFVDNRAIFQKPQKSKCFNSFKIGLKCVIIYGLIKNEVEKCSGYLVSVTKGVEVRVFIKNWESA